MTRESGQAVGHTQTVAVLHLVLLLQISSTFPDFGGQVEVPKDDSELHQSALCSAQAPPPRKRQGF